MKLYAEIAKTENQDDGTIKVWGWASTGSVDSDGEIVTAEAMKAALPDYMKFGAVREMHQPKAAGTAIEATVNEEGKTWFGAHVVDSEAVKKVKANVYKGFSIGGKVTDRDQMNKSIIKGIRLVEVSLVDRPANPEAVITIMKAERSAEDDVAELAALLDAGKMTPARLIELAKADVSAPASATPEVDKQPEQSPAGETVEKGLWNAQRLIEALGVVRSACESCDYETKRGEHTEALNAEMKATLAAMAEVTQKYLGEEIALMLNPPKTAPGDAVAMAEGVGDLEKKGARYSADTKKALGEVSRCMKEAMGHLDTMKFMDDDGEKAAGADDLAKAQADLGEAQQSITKLNADLDAVKAELDALKKQPAPGKALLKAIAVGKGDDSNLHPTTDEPDPALALKGEALALHQIKSLYRAVR